MTGTATRSATTTTSGPTTAAGDGGRRRGRVPWWGWAAAGVVLLAILIGAPAEGGEPCGLDNPAPIGCKALRLLLDDLGGGVDRISTAPDDDHDTALVLVDAFTDEALDEITEWVDDGGVLVVADPSSILMPSAPAVDFSEGIVLEADDELERDCTDDVPALDDVESVTTAGATLFRKPRGGVACFGFDTGYFVVAKERGDGTIVGLGGKGPFTNEHLDEADNAALIAALLAPTADTRIAVLEPDIGGGQKTLGDLVPRGIKQGLWQLAIAFLFVALWKGRRITRPVREPQPVQLAGSELVVAVGNLLQQARQRDQAAAHIRDALHRTVCERLGLPLTMPREQVVDAVVARTGVDRTKAATALLPMPIAGDPGLVSLAQTADEVRQEVADV